MTSLTSMSDDGRRGGHGPFEMIGLRNGLAFEFLAVALQAGRADPVGHWLHRRHSRFRRDGPPSGQRDGHHCVRRLAAPEPTSVGLRCPSQTAPIFSWFVHATSGSCRRFGGRVPRIQLKGGTRWLAAL